MGLQRNFRGKAPFANITENSLFFVNVVNSFQMSAQREFHLETLSAHVTIIRSFLGVDSFVDLDMVFRFEAFPAKIAHVGSDILMRFVHMSLKMH